MEESDIEIYSMNNEEKSERFIRTLKNKVYKDMTSVSNNVYIIKLAHIRNKYNNKYHNKIKMKSVNGKSNTSIGV